jgi:2-keto-4-pentenoate hydratase/2-oxohepta-3-ene-1,7-dioic acid hydratase in catechol pathway
MKELLSLGPDALARAEKAIESGQPVHRNSVKLLAPVPNPQKVICIGLNYADHAEESGAAIPEEPIVFSKFPTAVAADGDYIRLPSASSEVDYEAELVVVMGTGGRDIPLDQAYRHVAGYTCGHDVSARDWQLRKPGGQWLLGKSFDTFAPFGPELVTPDEVESPENLDICLRLNGKVMQKSNTDQLIFPIDHLISYVSTVCTLQPGDVIFTGTPPGVGAARKPPVFLKAGDKVEVEIEKIGILRNVVTA